MDPHSGKSYSHPIPSGILIPTASLQLSKSCSSFFAFYSCNFSGETLIQVQAFENPEDANTQIVYSLQVNSGTIGDALSFLTIDSGTGVITAAKSLDFEILSSLILSITASDGVFQHSVPLTITIDNINDNTPTLSSKLHLSIFYNIVSIFVIYG